MRLLYLGPPDMIDHVKANLSNSFDVQHATNDAQVDSLIISSDVILDAYMKIRFPAERLNQAAGLRLFVTATTGADHIDGKALAERGIPLLTLKGQREILRNITPAAEHSWMLLMACARQMRAAVSEPLAGEWDRNKFPGIMLRGKTIGIIGCGRIGQWMARYANAFGMQCLGYDPYVDPWPDHIQKTNLDELLSQSDFITVHVNLTDETRGLLGRQEFECMKSGVIFINTSRGDIADEKEILAALQENRLAAVGLDVLSGEPDIDGHPLIAYARDHDNLIITPHIGGFSPDALKYVLSFSCQRINDYFRETHEQ